MSESERIIVKDGVFRLITNPYIAISTTKHFHVLGEDGKGGYTVVMYEWETTSKLRVNEDLVTYYMTVQNESLGTSYILNENRKGGNYYKITFMKNGEYMNILVTAKKGGGIIGRSPFIEPEHILKHVKEILS
jgi:hypothetical protein